MNKLFISIEFLLFILFASCLNNQTSLQIQASPLTLYRHDGVKVFDYKSVNSEDDSKCFSFKCESILSCANDSASNSSLFPNGIISFTQNRTIKLIVGQDLQKKECLVADFNIVIPGMILQKQEGRAIYFLGSGNLRGASGFSSFVHYYFVEPLYNHAFIYTVSNEHGFLGIHSLLKTPNGFVTNDLFGFCFLDNCDKVNVMFYENNK
jgi:hypothetical protein